MAEFSWLPFLLQTADPLFPTGAYAHSLGFEEAVRLGIVGDEATLRAFLLEQILPAQREHELPYLRFAFDAAREGDMDALRGIDDEIGAWKLAPETREASAQLGTRRLKALLGVNAHPLPREFDAMVADRKCHGHHLTVSGIQGVVEGTPLEAVLTASCYQSLAAVCGAAMKLIRIGQDGCQRVLRDAASRVEEAVAGSLTVTRGKAGWFNPVLEIASLRHARADERLFIS